MNEREIFLAALERDDPRTRGAFLDQACAGDPMLRAKVESLLKSHQEAGSFLLEPATTDAATVAGTVEADRDAGRSGGPDAGGVRGLDPAATLETRGDRAAAGSPPPEMVTGVNRPAGDALTIEGPRPAGSPGPGRFVPGRVIAGRYGLLEILGEGGMGTVYRAEQTHPVKRQVALKLIKVGMDSRSVLARFDAERQALALMDHPNIARVYDGGTTDANQPFFVMEFVQGVPITEYCDRHRLPVRARLELFAAVCQAVQHAHQKGIIHRDLKPGNVMVAEVDGRPTPKVIDFGVAKATGFELTDQSLGDTGAIVGTPAYMSPEQADPSSMDIDTRTDIYALGVILYELLAGSPPIDASQFKRGAFLEMLRMVREDDPPRPSTKVGTADALPDIAATRGIEPGQLKRMLRGDLDWIVMKALEKDRARRYETANGFGADVMRHLASEPVLAAPPSRAYRMRKFARKHRGGLVAASLVLLALLAGFAGTTWGLIQAARANAGLSASLERETGANNALADANADLSRSRAAVQQRYDLAVEAIRTFHTGVSEDFLLKEEKFRALRDRLLKSASDFYGKLGALLGAEADPASRRALARANFELAELTAKVGRAEDALAAHRAVLARREALAADPEGRVDIGRSLTAVASILQANGDGDEAEATFRRAEALLAGLVRPTPRAEARAALADCRSRLGRLLAARGRTADALAAYRLARADQEAVAAPAGAPAAARRDLADTVQALGVLLTKARRRAEGEAEFRTALALYRRLADEDPAIAEYRGRLAYAHQELAASVSNQGRAEEGTAEMLAAMALYRRLADENPAVTEYRSRLASGHYSLAHVLCDSGRLADGEAEFREAVGRYRELVSEHPTVTKHRAMASDALTNLGDLLRKTGRPSEAESACREALAIARVLADEHAAEHLFRDVVAFACDTLGVLLLETGRAPEAGDLFRECLGIYQGLVVESPAVGGDEANRAWCLSHLARVQWQEGRATEAVASLRKAIDIHQTHGSRPPSPLASYSFACYHALLAGLADDPGSGLTAAEGRAEADRAMGDLRRSVDGGLRDPVSIRKDAAFKALRDRADFRLLWMDLAMPADPFAR